EILGEMIPERWQFFIVGIPSVLVIFYFWILLKGPIGRAFVAVRDNDIAAEMAGINVSTFKLLAFTLSATLAGLGGGMMLLLMSYVRYDSFNLLDSIYFLVAIVIGGLGTFEGSIFAGFILAYQTRINDALAAVIPNGQDLRWAVLGGAVIFITV